MKEGEQAINMVISTKRRAGAQTEWETETSDSELQDEVCRSGNIGQHLHLSTTEKRSTPAC